jgi:hypothetical protein
MSRVFCVADATDATIGSYKKSRDPKRAVGFADPVYPFEARKWNELSVVSPTSTTAAEKDPTGRSNPNRPI